MGDPVLQLPLPLAILSAAVARYMTKEFVIVQNIRRVCLLDISADFGVKTNAKLTPIFSCVGRAKNGIQSCLVTVSLTSIFA